MPIFKTLAPHREWQDWFLLALGIDHRPRLSLVITEIETSGVLGILREVDRSFQPASKRSFRAENDDGVFSLIDVVGSSCFFILPSFFFFLSVFFPLPHFPSLFLIFFRHSLFFFFFLRSSLLQRGTADSQAELPDHPAAHQPSF